jgi:hypothetical protein
VTPKQIARKFAKAKPSETIEAAMKRSLAFAKAMIDADHEDVLVAGMSPMYSSDKVANVAKAVEKASAKITPSGKARGLLVQAKKRYGAPLPATLQALWTVLASPPHRTWLRAFCVRSFLDPALLLPPPKWATGAKLTTAWNPDRSSISDTRERFSYDYEGWLANAPNKVVTGKDLAKYKRHAYVLLDPALREDIITIARADSEHWFVVPALATKKYPAPVFSNHDDSEGASQLHAPDVRAWFSDEISQSITQSIEES